MIIRKCSHIKTELSLKATLKGHSSNVKHVVVSECDSRLYFGSNYTTIKVWCSVSNTCIATLHGHNHEVFCLSLSPKWHRLFSGSMDTTVRIWDTEKFQCLHILKGHTLVLSEHGDMLYLRSYDGTIKCWKVNHSL
jgi:F-box/WD-40 domain protein 7